MCFFEQRIPKEIAKALKFAKKWLGDSSDGQPKQQVSG
jgi:hypothetical protein